MFRLILLTLASLLGILALLGTPELAGSDGNSGTRAERPIAASAPHASAPPAATPGNTADAPRRTAAAAPAPPRAAEELLRAAMSAEPVRPRQAFGGPALKPSPDGASSTAAAVTIPGTDAAAASLYVAGESVNLRAEPAPSAKVVTALARGTAMQALGPTTGAWIEVEDGAGNRGFVSARYLTATQPD